MSEVGIYHRIENVKSIMDNLQSWSDVEISFSHQGAFEVTAHIRAKKQTDMNELAAIDEALTTHGFEEVEHTMGGSNTWEYEWSHENY